MCPKSADRWHAFKPVIWGAAILVTGLVHIAAPAFATEAVVTETAAAMTGEPLADTLHGTETAVLVTPEAEESHGWGSWFDWSSRHDAGETPVDPAIADRPPKPLPRIGVMPEEWVEPFEPYGLTEEMLVIGSVISLGGFAASAYIGITSPAGGLVAAIGMILLLPLEEFVLGGIGTALWLGTKHTWHFLTGQTLEWYEPANAEEIALWCETYNEC